MADPELKKSSLDDEAWKDLFKGLVKEDGKCIIEISDLEEALSDISNEDLRADYDLQDYQLKR